MAELVNPRAWAAADRQGSRLGAAAAVPTVLRQGSGHGVDQLEGLGCRARRAAGINGSIAASRKWSRARSGLHVQRAALTRISQRATRAFTRVRWRGPGPSSEFHP